MRIPYEFIALMAALSFAVIAFILFILLEWGFAEIATNAPRWRHKMRVKTAQRLRRCRRLMAWLGDEPAANSQKSVTLRTDWRN